MDGLAAALDFSFYLLCGCLVFLMQLGFAMVRARASPCVNDRQASCIPTSRIASYPTSRLRHESCTHAFSAAPPYFSRQLEVGCVNQKNINNIILKGVLDICIAALAFWYARAQRVSSANTDAHTDTHTRVFSHM